MNALLSKTTVTTPRSIKSDLIGNAKKDTWYLPTPHQSTVSSVASNTALNVVTKYTLECLENWRCKPSRMTRNFRKCLSNRILNNAQFVEQSVSGRRDATLWPVSHHSARRKLTFESSEEINYPSWSIIGIIDCTEYTVSHVIRLIRPRIENQYKNKIKSSPFCQIIRTEKIR